MRSAAIPSAGIYRPSPARNQSKLDVPQFPVTNTLWNHHENGIQSQLIGINPIPIGINPTSEYEQ